MPTPQTIHDDTVSKISIALDKYDPVIRYRTRLVAMENGIVWDHRFFINEIYELAYDIKIEDAFDE